MQDRHRPLERQVPPPPDGVPQLRGHEGSVRVVVVCVVVCVVVRVEVAVVTGFVLAVMISVVASEVEVLETAAKMQLRWNPSKR